MNFRIYYPQLDKYASMYDIKTDHPNTLDVFVRRTPAKETKNKITFTFDDCYIFIGSWIPAKDITITCYINQMPELFLPLDLLCKFMNRETVPSGVFIREALNYEPYTWDFSPFMEYETTEISEEEKEEWKKLM